MKPALSLLLLACGASLLAGCHAGEADNAAFAGMNEEEMAIAQQRPPNREKVMQDRWRQMFANPAAIRAAAGDFGFQAGELTATGADPAYRMSAPDQLYPRADAPITIDVSFEATGPAADRVDRIRFSFKAVMHSKPINKKDREIVKAPLTTVRGFLGRFNLGLSHEIADAIRSGESAIETTEGSRIVIVAQPVPGLPEDKAKQLTVTITDLKASAKTA